MKEKRMRAAGIWRGLLALILVLTLLGVSRVWGDESAVAETAAPETAEPSVAPAPPVPPTPQAPLPPADRETPAAAVTPPPAKAGELILKAFRIEGNKTVSSKDLIKEISLKRPSFWPPWGKPATIRLQDVEYDGELLRNYYRRQGFYHAKITPEVTYGPGREVSIVLRVDEGPWVKITDINVEIAGTLDLAELRKKWPLKIGSRFTEKAYDDFKNLYLNYLPNHGYPKVKVRGRVYLNEETNTARILLSVNPGPLCYFGGVNIQDEEKLETPAAAIREKITIKAGQVFNLGELFNTQRKLYGTNLFKSVVLTPEQVPPQESTIPILVQLEERKKRSFKFGLGYGDEDKVRVRTGLVYRNLWGGGRLLTLNAQYSTLGYLYSQSFYNPVVFNSKFDFVNETGVRRRYLPGFNDQAYFTQSRLERDIPWNLRMYFGHGLEFARPFDIPVETLIMLQGTQPEQMYRASFAVLGLRRETTDSAIDPHRGSIFVLANQFAPNFFGSGLQFVQSVLDLKRYHTVGDSNFVVAGRVRCGLIQPVQSTTQIPISRLFFSGGATSVRGYQLDYLSPRNASNNPTGGEAVVEFSLEGRFPLPVYQKIGGVIFIDAGDVYPKIHNFDLGQLKYSPGFGLRYLSPIGPIGIDIAFPTNRINYQQDSPYQIHFTVGYGF